MDRKELQNLEVPPGVGAAALLLFLHIAIVGYVAFIIGFYLIRGSFWSLFHPTASWEIFFPIFLGIFTYLPTDKLTKTVAKTALVVCSIAAVLVCGGLIAKLLSAPPEGISKLNGLSNLLSGLIVAVLFRLSLKNFLNDRATNTTKPKKGIVFLIPAILILLALICFSGAVFR